MQEVLEDVLSKLLNENIVVVGAGRTDAGVHAQEMFAHFDFVKEFNVADLIFRLNAFLPEDIAVRHIYSMKEEAHARFDASSRTYEYWLVQEKNPFYSDSAHYIKQAINIDKMNQAALLFLEHDDFECFSKSNTDVHTFLCNVEKAEWIQDGDKMVFTITADRFLRNMVRAIVGTLLNVGVGKIKIGAVKSILESKDRSKAGASVPAKGLYLTKIVYPETIFKNE